MTFGRALRLVRLASNLTVEELSERSFLSQSYITQIEGDQKNPSLSTMKKLATGLRVPLCIIVMMMERDNPVVAPFMSIVYSHALRGVER